ncbi:MAG: S8 family serine peptidase [Myxococcales bacterium]|nr:S8 family serine peptidase [Myxococcales bacterium]MCB9534437.1 S8 family serine peptidase [Myxococcales bacterium]
MPRAPLRRLLFATATLALTAVPACGDDPSETNPDAAEDATGDAATADSSDAGADADADAAVDVRPDAGTAEEPYTVVPGEAEAPAVDALLNVGPFMLADDELDGTFANNRLNAVLAAGVTIADLNAALADAGAAITTARTASPAVTLLVPTLADAEAARALADTLEASGAFAAVMPAFVSEPDAIPPEAEKLAPAGARLTHERTRLHAAWNVANQINRRIPVMVADCYVELRAHPGISAQSFRINATTGPHARLTQRGQLSGNHGFWVSSILGADIGTTLSFGTSLDPANDLEIVSVQVCGMTWNDRLTVLEDFALSADPWVLNASIGYNDPLEVDESRADRATYALLWRAALRRIGSDRLLVVAAAGNDGDERPAPTTQVTSPFGTQALLADVRDIVPAARRASVDAVAASLGLGADENRVLGHTVMVGSSDEAGARSAFSTPGEDVRVLGENVSGLCLVDDAAGPRGPALDPPTCVGGEMFSSGSSASAPQVSGIAAMWLGASNIETPASVRARLLDASENGTVNAYGPLLQIIHDAGRDPLSIVCDVNDDARCDEDDVDELLAGWESVEETPGGDLFETWGRYDLNGDGFERTDRGTPFDLDFDGSSTDIVTLPAGDSEVTLREIDATDLTVLCAAAYSDAWDGDVEARDERLAEPCGVSEEPTLTPGTTWSGTINYTSVVTTTPIPGACTSTPPSGSGNTTMSARIECSGEPGEGTPMFCTLIDGSWSTNSARSTPLGPWGASPRLLGASACVSNDDCGGASPNCLAQDPVCGDDDPSEAPGVCGRCVTYGRSGLDVVSTTSADLSEQRGAQIALVGFIGGELRADVLTPAAEGTQTTTSHVESRVEGVDASRPCEPFVAPSPETREVFGFGGDLLVGGAEGTMTETTITATSSSDRRDDAFDGLSSTSVTTSMTLTLRAVTTP